jgi:flagellar hook-associated protein 3 FlgL
MISLSTGAFYDRATRQIGSLRSEADNLQRQIGSGERLSRSSDDPVAAAQLRTLSRSQRLADIDQRNSDLAQSNLKLTDSALGQVANVVIRAKELATAAANGTLSIDQRSSIGTEIENLRQSLLLLANSRDSAGHALFGGQAAGAAFDSSGASIAYVGTAGADPIQLGDGQAVTPALTGPEVFAFGLNGSQTDLFAVLGTLATALQNGDQGAAGRDAMTALDAGLDKVTSAQTIIGARMSWVELMDERRTTTGEMAADQQATIGGADLAATMTRLQEITTVLEASQASFVRLANLSLFDLLR